MFQIVALGKSEFLLGFRLAGIHTIETSEDPREDFEKTSWKIFLGIN